ncbi:MAG: ABC transporter ATP-binding protein [Lachnospiraceae bacterium]
MIKSLKKRFALSDQGARDLAKGIVYTVLVNISLMFPVALLAYILLPLLNSSENHSYSTQDIAIFAVIGIVILAVMFIFHYLQYTSTYIGTYEESERRRISLAEKLRTLPLSFFEERDTADLTGIIMADCANFEHAFSHTVPQFWGAVISTIIMCIALVCFNPMMGAALLWVAPVAFLIILLSRKWQQKLGLKHIQAKNDLADSIQECLENVLEIKACNYEDRYLLKLDAKLDAAEKSQVSSEMTSASLITSGQMFLRIGLATVIVVGNTFIMKGELDLFTYVLYLIAASRIYDPLSGAMANMAELFNVNLQVERLKEITEYPLQTGEEKWNGNRYDVTFDHVKYSYDAEKPVLNNVNFTAEQGKVTALVGPSGGGKSTVAKLAARFYNVNGGKILLGGEDISTLEPADLLMNFSIVFQDVVLFNNTIMENIRVGRQTANDEEVVQAAKEACCDEMIKKLPEGYQTVVGENGSALSGGERQRISIARAILKNTPVILLDEATASLDVDSETQVQSALTHLIAGKTVLVIAHRMRTIEAADKIIVLKDGTIKESGTHQELINKQGIYQNMVRMQQEANNWNLK